MLLGPSGTELGMRKSAYGTPLVIKDDASPIALEKVALSDSSYNEKFIQELVFTVSFCLPINVFIPRAQRIAESA